MILAAAMWCSVFAPARVRAQAEPCDPALASSLADPWGYRVRGERCEGIYAQPVAGTALIVASFTERFDRFAPDSTASLLVGWPSVPTRQIRLRAISLRRRYYYRMDASRVASAGSWMWPTTVLAALDLGRDELGVLAWTNHTADDAELDIYLPLRIGVDETSDTSQEYALVVVPQVELSEVFVSVSSMDENGRLVGRLRDEDPLGYGYYPAERPVEIPIARPAEPGLYRVELGARIRTGGSLVRELWFETGPF